MKHVFLGVDPGDRWVGVARLIVRQRLTRGLQFRAETQVFDRTLLNFGDLVRRIVFQPYVPTRIVTEEYRVRPLGHQAWTNGQTLQLIGALRYVAHQQLEVPWTQVHAGPVELLDGLPLGPIIRAAQRDWPESSGRRWLHGLSAWRVLAYDLSVMRPDLMGLLVQSPPTAIITEPARSLDDTCWSAPPSTWKVV